MCSRTEPGATVGRPWLILRHRAGQVLAMDLARRRLCLLSELCFCGVMLLYVRVGIVCAY